MTLKQYPLRPMQQAKALIKEVLERVYESPHLCERAILAHFDRVKKETAPEIEDLKAEVAKLRRMVVWSYTLSSDQLRNFDDAECEVTAAGSYFDGVEWAFSCIECDFDSEHPSDKDIFPWS